MSRPTPSGVMRERIERAVDGEGSAALLQDWLQGYRMPPLGEEDEPYVWLIRGLLEIPESERRDEVTRRLAAWLAEILEQRPDVEKLGHLPDRLLYNALMFAGGLECPEILWEPLLGALERNKLENRKYHGIPLQGSLRTALVNNQLDSHLEDDWLAMAEGDDHGRLRGNVFDGFRALAQMPPEEAEQVLAWDSLENALTYQIENVFDGNKNKKLRYLIRDQMREVVDRRSEHRRQVSRFFLRVAHKRLWPEWTVTLLPSLYLEHEDGRSMYLWYRYREVLNGAFGRNLEASEWLCHEEVLRVRLQPEERQFAGQVLPKLEEHRLASLTVSDRAERGDVLHALFELELQAGDQEKRRRLSRARESILQETDVAASSASALGAGP